MKTVLKNHFIPHADNDYKPHILQKAALVAMVVLVALSFTMANIQALFWINSDWMISTILPAVVVAETNDERGDEDLVQLRRNTTLDAAAQLKAEHMAANEYFAHFAPDGTSPWFWFGQVDYGFVHAGENLAIHFSDSSEVVEAWMDSPTHRANILNGDFREIGIGVAEGSYEGYKTLYVVQLFGTPAVASPAPVIPPVVAVTTPAPEPAPVVAAAATETPAPVVVQETPVNEPEIIQIQTTETAEVAGAEDEVVVAEDRDQEPVTTMVTEIVETELVTDAAAAETTNDITEIAVQDSGVVAYSDLISTTTGAIPASIDGESVSKTEKPFFAFATQPQFVLQVLYVMLGLFVIGALMLSILIEIRKQHPIQIGYGLAMLLLMYGLYSVHTAVTSGAAII